MHGEGFLYQAFVYLAAAIVAVPIAKRLGLGSVLGYLLAGVAIGPFGLGLIGAEGAELMEFAEFGVVMMLFVIGLELEPERLWAQRGLLLGLGGLQLLGTAVVLGGLALAVGQSWQAALAIGLILALSSTAIVLQSLAERGVLKTAAGERTFVVLLFQDIAVIPLLAILPLLAVTGGGEVVASGGVVDTLASAAAGAADAHGAHGGGALADLPAWLRGLVTLAAVAAIVVGGRTIVRPVFRFIAKTRLRELFTAAALLLVIGIALLMETVGLSPALGTFLAGVVLATSEFRHELEGDIEPFKGLLLGLFFLAVGASVDFALVAGNGGAIAGIVAAIVVGKLLVLLALGRGFGLSLDQNTLFAFALAQGGEFCFVLLAFAESNNVLAPLVAKMLVAAVALSMVITPLLLLVHERLLAPRFGTRESVTRPADTPRDDAPVIIAGFGQFGSTIGRLLRTQGIRPVVLELDSDRVDLLRRLGLEVYYGDATRPELLESAGIGRARLLVLALGDDEQARVIVHYAKEQHPNLPVLTRATSRSGTFDLLQAHATGVYRDTVDTALRVGAEALTVLGVPAHHAHRLSLAFRRHDERHLQALAAERMELDVFIDRVRENIRLLEEQLASDFAGDRSTVQDAAWDATTLRAEAQERAARG